MYSTAPIKQKERYLVNLAAHCSLSLLHSDSKVPFLEYRVSENVFCDCFEARNVSRSDVAVDAIIGNLGIGIKTFVSNPFQKIAEFDKKSAFHDMIDELEIVKEVSRLRNSRLDRTSKRFGLDDLIYHYIVRYEGMIRIFECPMEHIDVDSIVYATRNGNTIEFTDNRRRYKFSLSKSTILMEFDLSNPLEELPIKIFDDPSSSIIDLYESKFGKITIDPSEKDDEDFEVELREQLPNNPYLEDTVLLPLYSEKRTGQNVVRYVHEKSGINQWNAGGRKRHPREIYIRVPAYIHKEHPGFFPPRTESFDLEIPGGKRLKAKICQSGDKALMSDPNNALGFWLLDGVFQQPVGKVLTYEDMERLHINAVRVSKTKEGLYYINFVYIPHGYESGSMIQVSSFR